MPRNIKNCLETKTFSFKTTVFGQLMSKANSRRIVMFGNRPASIKSAKANAYTESFLIQSKSWNHQGQEWPYTGDVVLTARVYYASRRPDLDIELLKDCIQKSGIILNDRQVKEQHAFWFLDKNNPRVDFWIEEKSTISFIS